jgi:hypothetical protein
MRTGLYAGDAGVRVRWLSRTRTYAWTRAEAVEAAPALLLGSPTSRAAVWLNLVDGEQVDSPGAAPRAPGPRIGDDRQERRPGPAAGQMRPAHPRS